MNRTATLRLISARSRGALALTVGALLGAAAIAGAATSQDNVPRISIHYSPEDLATEEGARRVYRQLVNAAEQLCPSDSTGTRLVNPAVQHCRDATVARAVRDINNPRLAEVYANSGKHG